MFPPINITSFPNEIILKILYEVFASEAPILPFVTTCKAFYHDFEFLLYIVKPFRVIYEYNNNKKSDTKSSAIVKRLLRDDGCKITNKLSALDVVFLPKPTHKFATQQCTDLEALLVENLFDNGNFFNKLKILNLKINSLVLFSQILSSIPKNLVVLKVVIVKITSKNFKRSSYSQLLKAITRYRPNTLSYLEYFTLCFQKCSTITAHAIHPVLGHYHDTTQSYSEENRNFKNSNSLFIRIYHGFQDQITWSNRCKLLIGSQINQFLHQNRISLKKVEMLGIDLNLIFQLKLPIPSFAKLRIFSFDNTSRANMSYWLSRLQKEAQIPIYKEDKPPILILFDSMAERLYYKSFEVLKPLDSVHEMNLWNYSDEYRVSYALLNRERDILY